MGFISASILYCRSRPSLLPLLCTRHANKATAADAELSQSVRVPHSTRCAALACVLLRLSR
eukprot:scaffold28045_cov153-Isochrysis_galbana.AAC.1